MEATPVRDWPCVMYVSYGFLEDIGYDVPEISN